MSGKKEDHKPEKFHSMPMVALAEVMRVYGYGGEKYARYNYLEGYPYYKSIDALMRHFMAFVDDTQDDLDESGHHHLAHAAWHIMNLLNMSLQPERYGQFDDRQEVARVTHPEYYDADAGFHQDKPEA